MTAPHPLIQPFRAGEDREVRKAKMMRINEITETAAKAMVEGDVVFAAAVHKALAAAHILVNPEAPTLWQAEEQD